MASSLLCPPWLATMRAITGTLETPGAADNPTILEWRDEIARRYPDMAPYCANYTHDSIAWCGLTIAYVMAVNGIRPVFGRTDTDRFLWANAWQQFGRRLDKPQLGCVMVFTRSGGGHVSLYEGEEGDNYVIRGGNQSDSVCVTRMSKTKFSGAFWPPLANADRQADPPPNPATAPPPLGVRFRSLVPGGYYSADPFDASVNVSIRTNNPGALNVAPWLRTFPGFVGDKVTSDSSGKGGGVNSTVIFETPEQGVAAWWELMRKYRAAGATTVAQIVNRYGGGQDYAAYVDAVARWSGLSAGTVIALDDDAVLLPFAKAMFRYEAGRPSPLKDEQILYGLKLGRGSVAPPATPPIAGPVVVGAGAATGAAALLYNGQFIAAAALIVAVVIGLVILFRSRS